MSDNPDEAPTGPAVAVVVVGTDGSPAATKAVQFAAQMARQLGAEAVLVHAVGLLEHLAGHEAEPAVAALPEVEQLLRGPWSQPFLDAGVPVRCVLEPGPPTLALPRLASRIGADLIIVASHGETESVGRALGSTALSMVSESPIPVLLVPDTSRR